MTQFIQDDPQTPDIQLQILLFVGVNLGREVLPGPAHCGPFLGRVDHAGKPEICQFHVILTIK